MDVDPTYQPLLREIGLDADGVFTDPRVKVWRKLTDRENCTLDETLHDGQTVRLHIKRYPNPEPTLAETRGYRLLREANIPAAPIIAHGQLADGKSFIILKDLAGYTPADKFLFSGGPFADLLAPTAAVAARLHNASLHHRDLYLCHFMVKKIADKIDVQMIDTARVAKLTNPLTRRRWIIKDLAQFWYSTRVHPISAEMKDSWLAEYSRHRQVEPDSLRPAIHRKANAIARHDKNLNQQQPHRNISIPKP